MRRMVCFTLVLLAMATLSGCLGGRPIRYYTVELPLAPHASTSKYPITLLVGHVGAPEILEDQPIVYRTGQNEIGVYEYHQWAESPTQMVKTVLMRRLRASGRYQSVAGLGSSAEGEFVLHGTLYDFEEVDKGKSITALVSMEFELFDRRSHKTVWTDFYSKTEPVQGKQISNVVSAIDRDFEQGLAQVESGLNTYFSAGIHGKH